jgi:hypothetical protein
MTIEWMNEWMNTEVINKHNKIKLYMLRITKQNILDSLTHKFFLKGKISLATMVWVV